MPAQATAKSVIASAKRLIDVRHCCRSRSRIAEISVPAWPMPIHQTKLMMSKPQPTGTLMPQMPTPFAQQVRRRVARSISRSAKATAKPTNQPSGVFVVRTRLAILSVTVANVWPGADDRGSTRRLGARRAPLGVGSPCPPPRELRVRVPHRREVGRARPRVQLGEQAVVPRLAFSFETRLAGSLRSPKTIACAGQAAWQAVTISPSRMARPCVLRRRCGRG